MTHRAVEPARGVVRSPSTKREEEGLVVRVLVPVDLVPVEQWPPAHGWKPETEPARPRELAAQTDR
jgi:hypothetical protein